MTLELLKHVNLKEYGFIHLLSGVDMPIRSNSEFDTFFGKTLYEGFFTFASHEFVVRASKERMMRYYLYDWFDRRSSCLIIKAIHSLMFRVQNCLETMGVKIRKPLSATIYMGSQWFSISSRLALYIVEFCIHNKEFVKRFRYTSCCDELFFHTIVMKSPFAPQICNNNHRYVDWNRKYPGESLPRVLDESDYESIINSDCFFCRKLDVNKSSSLIELIIHGGNKKTF